MKKILLLTSLFTLFMYLTTFSYATNISNDLSNYFLRIHVIANSDSVEDQELKIKVKNNIASFIKKQNLNSKTNTIKFIEENDVIIQEIANTTIKNEGYNYPIKISITNSYFPTKNYENLSLPAGYYDALKIEIGNAKGKNWWCSLFPPLCFSNTTIGELSPESIAKLNSDLPQDETNLILNNSKKHTLKFKIIELFNN